MNSTILNYHLCKIEGQMKMNEIDINKFYEKT